jgi:hypothetical protein
MVHSSKSHSGSGIYWSEIVGRGGQDEPKKHREVVLPGWGVDETVVYKRLALSPI